MNEIMILERLERIEANSRLAAMAAKNVLQIEDVSLLTGLSKSHIYKLTCKKEIPHYKKCGKMLYFDKAEVEAWLKETRVMTVAEAEQQAFAYIAKKNM